MKKDTQTRPGVNSSKPKAASAPIGEPPRGNPAQVPRRMDAVPSITLSARYIDSRLKQFCYR